MNYSIIPYDGREKIYVTREIRITIVNDLYYTKSLYLVNSLFN